jgi:diguanylate cyclase (GGDEF)-like protein
VPDTILPTWLPLSVLSSSLALVCAIGLSLLLARHSRAPGVTALLAAVAALLLWSLAILIPALLGRADLSPALTLPAELLLPVAWLAFAVAYARQQPRMQNLPLAVLATPMLLAVPLVWLPALQSHFWQQPGLPGPGLLLVYAYAIALAVAACAVLSFVLTSSRSYRTPLLVLTSWTLLYIGLQLSWISGRPLPHNLDNLALTVGLLPVVLNLLHGGYLALRPMVRSQVFNHLPDGVLIIDAKGRLLDANPEALTSLLRLPAISHRQKLNELIPSPVIAELVSGRLHSGELTLGDRAYHVNAASLGEQQSRHRQVLVFRDITDRRNAEMEVRKVQQELERMAHQDPLTGLFNRRVFLARMAEESERVRRHGNPLSVLLFDLDHFKRVNDSYGHDVGDRVLQAVAQAATGIRRVTDIPARIGGEEFAILLPETDRDGALQIAQRLRAAVAALRIPHVGGELNITTSVGVATLTRMSYTEDSLLNDADKALYRAKHAGRNMVCLAD